MRVLVTGADGFIGAHLVRGLTAAGHDVTSVVFMRPARAKEVRVDLTQPAQHLALPVDVEAIVHAAGVVDQRASLEQMRAVNVEATRALAGWARSRGVKHFVQLSSVAVYGPLLLGENRTEDTPRLGLGMGLPYMITKAHAERAIEQSRVPFTHLRPPGVLGPGDTVITGGFAEALGGQGIPLLPGASPDRRVSLVTVDGLVQLTAKVLAHGPLGGAVHAVDLDLRLAELAELYARALGRPCNYVSIPWGTALRRRADSGFSWLVASARFGQHYSVERLEKRFAWVSGAVPDRAIEAAVSSLQGRGPSLS